MASERGYIVKPKLSHLELDRVHCVAQFCVLDSSKVITHSFEKLEDDFLKMITVVRAAAEQGKMDDLADSDKLRIYAWYKQANIGNNRNSMPSIFSPKARAKHLAWKSVEGATRIEAVIEYIIAVMDAKLV